MSSESIGRAGEHPVVRPPPHQWRASRSASLGWTQPRHHNWGTWDQSQHRPASRHDREPREKARPTSRPPTTRVSGVGSGAARVTQVTRLTCSRQPARIFRRLSGTSLSGGGARAGPQRWESGGSSDRRAGPGTQCRAVSSRRPYIVSTGGQARGRSGGFPQRVAGENSMRTPPTAQCRMFANIVLPQIVKEVACGVSNEKYDCKTRMR